MALGYEIEIWFDLAENGRFRTFRAVPCDFSDLTAPQTPFQKEKVLGGLWKEINVILGYARVSTEGQSLEAQLDALNAAGVERIFSEKISGSRLARPELDKLIDQLRPGDVVTVTKYDRLSRSLQDLLAIVEEIRSKGAGFRSLAEEINTTSSAGRLVFHVFASIAQFERERISERTREGLAAARKAGRIGGRPPVLSRHQRDEVRRLRDEEGRRVAEIARLFEVSPNTVRRA